MEPQETLGKMLQRLRLAAGLTLSQVALAASVPLSSLQNWEVDRREPGLRTAVALARALGVTAEALADTLPVERARKVDRPPVPVRRSAFKDFRTTRPSPPKGRGGPRKRTP